MEFFATSNYRLSYAAVSFSEDFRAVIDHRHTRRGVQSHVSHLHQTEGSGFVLNITISEPYQAGVSQALSLNSSSASAAVPAVSQAPRSRLGSSDRLTLRDAVRLGAFNCRTISKSLLREGKRGDDSRSHCDF